MTVTKTTSTGFQPLIRSTAFAFVVLAVAGASTTASMAQTFPTPSVAPVAGSASDEVRATLEAIRAKYSLPSLAGGFSVGNNVLEYAATGYRQWGAETKVTDDDIYHLGSVTKSMTGTVIANLVEQGTLSWDASLDQLLPGFAMRDEFKSVTLNMLMAHRSGISGVTYPPGWPVAPFNGLPVTSEQRRAYIQFILSRPPTSTPGTAYEYSNPGTATAAFAAEQKTGKSFEQLVTELVWQPLGMGSCSMGTIWPSPTVQPNPHKWSASTPVASLVGTGNSRVIDGADQGRCSTRDLVAYGRAHATGESAGGLLSADSWKGLHTVKFPGQVYAAGWVVGKDNGQPVLGHAGSNTSNYATVTLFPTSQISVIVLTNIGAALPENTLTRTAGAEREAYAALVAIAERRRAALVTQAGPATTVAPSPVASTTPTSGASPAKAKKVCTVNKKTKRKVCR